MSKRKIDEVETGGGAESEVTETQAPEADTSKKVALDTGGDKPTPVSAGQSEATSDAVPAEATPAAPAGATAEAQEDTGASVAPSNEVVPNAPIGPVAIGDVAADVVNAGGDSTAEGSAELEKGTVVDLTPRLTRNRNGATLLRKPLRNRTPRRVCTDARTFSRANHWQRLVGLLIGGLRCPHELCRRVRSATHRVTISGSD